MSDYTLYCDDPDDRDYIRRVIRACEKWGNPVPVYKYAEAEWLNMAKLAPGMQWFVVIGTRGTLEVIGPFRSAAKAVDYANSIPVDGAVVQLPSGTAAQGTLSVHIVPPV